MGFRVRVMESLGRVGLLASGRGLLGSHGVKDRAVTIFRGVGVWGLGFRVSGLGYRVQGIGLRVRWGVGLRA